MGNSIIKQEAVTALATKLEVDNVSLLNMLVRTVCKEIDGDDEALLAFITVCNNYKLNPLIKEICVYRNKKQAIITVVNIDGWLAIANRNPLCDGIQCEPIIEDGRMEAVKCTIWRKDRKYPSIHSEYMRACKQNTDYSPWKSHPERMLEWKAIIQTVRIAFSISGIYDPDEAELIEPDKPVQQIALKFADEDIPDADFSEKPSTVINKKIDAKQADDEYDKTQPVQADENTVEVLSKITKPKRKDLLAPPGDDAEKFEKTHGKGATKSNPEADVLIFAKEAGISVEAASIIMDTQKNNPELFKVAKEVISRKLYQKFTRVELVKLAKVITDMEAK